MNLTQAYIYLVVAILLEITATSFLKDTQGFTKWIPSVVCIITVCICMYLMSHVMKIVPVAITYATWSGLGIVAITIIGIVKYKQIPNLATIFGLSLIIIGVIIVNLMNNIKIEN